MPDDHGARELLGELAERSAAGLAVVSVEGQVRWWNPTFERLAGSVPAMAGHALQLASDGPWGGVLEAVRRTLATGHSELLHDVRVQGPVAVADRYMDVEIVPLPDRSGSLTQAALYVRDVTGTFSERERARLFYTSFLTSTNAIEATDARGVLVDVNPAFERIYGYRREELIGKRPNIVRSKFTPPEIYQELWTSITDPSRGFWSGEMLNRDKRGRERPVFLNITAVRNAEGEATHYVGVAVDLTERRAWEQQAAHSDKLASLGTLAAGVAHEINTPLANVMLIAESIRRRTTDAWVRSRIATVTEQIENAARIVRGLLDFARRSEPQMAMVDLGQVARDALEFVRGKQSQDVEVVLDLPPDPVTVLGDRGQLIQVFTNLLINSFDAMNGRGRVRVELRDGGQFAAVEVTDTGPGIPEQVMPHIFEPFFTTKGDGKGTGLGLAVCHGIVQAHHGTIAAANGPGGGAVFRVALPIHHA